MQHKKKIEKINREMLQFDIVEAEGNRIGVFDVNQIEKIFDKLDEIIDFLNSLEERK